MKNSDILPLEDLLEEFFTDHPDPEEVDMLLWRMFFHATLYDQERNGVAAFLEDYGRMYEDLKRLLTGLRIYANTPENKE